jgi:hypothetical protein
MKVFVNVYAALAVAAMVSCGCSSNPSGLGSGTDDRGG